MGRRQKDSKELLIASAAFSSFRFSRYNQGMQLIVENFEGMAPVILNPNRAVPMSDEEFLDFCSQYPDCLIEQSAAGEISIMPPTYTKTGNRNLRIGARLMQWTETTPEGAKGEAFDSSTGFKLPNGARRSPDASWVSRDRIDALPSSAQETFYTLCPDFVIELRSVNDRLPNLHRKMAEYIDNGAQLGWLIDPQEKSVTIYRPGHNPELLQNPAEVVGEGPVAGFVLSLSGILV